MDVVTILGTLKNLTNARITKADLARALGVDPAALRRKELAEVEFKQSEIKKIENYFNVKIFEKNDEENNIKIPVRGSVSASMGYGVTVYNEEQTGTYNISAKLVKDLGLIPEKTEMIFASGDSMLPTIEGGDSLLIDLNRKEVYDGRIYCIRYDGQLYAKRLQRLSRNKIKIISDNKYYEPVTLDFTADNFDFEVIGEIRWCGRVFL